MKLVRASLAAAGSVVLPLDTSKTVMNDLITMYGSSTINATAQVDGTISDLGNRIPVTVSRATTVITVTFPTLNPHTLGGTTDYVVISGTGNSNLDGTFPLATVTNDTVLTVTSGSSGTISAVNGFATPIRFMKTVIASASVSATTPAFPAVTTTSIPLSNIPFSAVILQVTSYTAGTAYVDVRQSGLAD